MPARTQISVEEYLALSFPDHAEPEYAAGELVERTAPHPLHGQIQILLGILFARLRERAPRMALISELRARVAADRIRIIDFAAYLDSRPPGPCATTAAYVAVEIASPDDRLNNILEKLDEYRRWGVPHVWLVNPWSRRVYEYNEAGLMERSALRLADFDFEITAAELFQDI